ncbi:MAG: hypothetical protein KDD33_02825 [Bdellovibrionales bacterium]|nr:hypothetical protein [Bdellovibrionales bacterium]
MKRRLFVKQLGLLMTLAPQKAFAYPISQLLGEANPAYIQQYFHRMKNWYSQQFFPIQKLWTRSEGRFIQSWEQRLTSWGFDLKDFGFVENFNFSHSVRPQSVRHDRFLCASENWSSAEQAEIRSLIRARGQVPPDMDRCLAMGWEGDRFKIYYQGKLPDQFHSLVQDKNQPHVLFHHIQGGKIVKEGVIQATREFPLPIAGMISQNVISALSIHELGGKPRYHYRLKSFFLPLLSNQAIVLSSQHLKEFHQMNDSMQLISSQEYKLYYP